MSTKLLPTTVVGSYPATLSRAAYMTAYREGRDPYLESLAQAVEAQVAAGVDVISDGQTRAGIVPLFAQRLGGIRMKGRPVIFDEVRFLRPITTDDLVRARDVAAGRAEVKGIITGPYTMVRGCVNEFYEREEDAAFALARALNAEARALAAAGAVAIQVDEPFFSLELPPYAVELVRTITNGLEVPTILHVCGRTAPILDTLAAMPTDTIDLEFAADPALLDAVAAASLPQRIGVGCVRSDDDRVETVDEVTSHLRRACELLGEEKVVVDPDCGLSHRTPEVADGKLAALVAAARLLRKELA